MIRTIRFASCDLTILEPAWERPQWHTEAVFPDGAVSAAYPPWGDPDHVQAAWFCGYGGDQWRMMVEHEIAHAFIADWMGEPHSASVWSHAHGTAKGGLGTASERVKREEHLVTRFQRFVNTGAGDEYGVIEQAFGDNLHGAAIEFLRLSRPWFWASAA